MDIIDNQEHLRFKAVAATVNAGYAIKAALNPTKNTILVEKGSSVYACLIAVQARDANKPWGQQRVSADQSSDALHANFNPRLS
ncbi:NLPA lipoprotein [Paraburkholderia unamae]|uniref:MetQ/NlpA family ABC transporter substrate-binding protein n=1 Tax=Paraburkholderia unamae TaxID=219649 RepID=UPI000DC3A774|nr:MetQ/NlpA family ABC transporter substrate-binding protein [Paraburkholderia unamae]RAR57555.1 NLPA lipoprotein [Paraburkholderia unamae]